MCVCVCVTVYMYTFITLDTSKHCIFLWGSVDQNSAQKILIEILINFKLIFKLLHIVGTGKEISRHEKVNPNLQEVPEDLKLTYGEYG